MPIRPTTFTLPTSTQPCQPNRGRGRPKSENHRNGGIDHCGTVPNRTPPTNVRQGAPADYVCHPRSPTARAWSNASPADRRMTDRRMAKVAAGRGAGVFARFAYAPNDLSYCDLPTGRDRATGGHRRAGARPPATTAIAPQRSSAQEPKSIRDFEIPQAVTAPIRPSPSSIHLRVGC